MKALMQEADGAALQDKQWNHQTVAVALADGLEAEQNVEGRTSM